MLSRDGCPISDRGVKLVAPRSQTLNNLFSHANNLAFWSTQTLYARNLPQYQPVIELIRKAGLAVLWMNNPMALLGVSHSRKATRELDYGMIPVFCCGLQSLTHATQSMGSYKSLIRISEWTTRGL